MRVPNPDPTVERLIGTTFYGNKQFDMPYITEIERNLWVGGCASELILPEHIKHVVSLYFQEHYSALHMLSSDLYVQMADSVNEPFDNLDALARWVNHCRQDAPTLVHCQVGLNRSALIAARALYLSDGWPGADIVDLLREKRSPAVLCNPHFELEVRSWK